MLRVASPVAPAPTAAQVDWTSVLIFTILACGLGWLVCLPLWIDPAGLQSAHVWWVLPLLMFTPCAAAVIVAVLHQRLPVRHAFRQLGIVPIRPIGRTLGFTLAAIVLLPVVVAAGITLADFLHLVRLDLDTFSGFALCFPKKCGASCRSEYSFSCRSCRYRSPRYRTGCLRSVRRSGGAASCSLPYDLLATGPPC